MKKNVLALSIAAAVAGFAGSAHAITDIAAAANVAATTAEALRFGNTGTGHSLLVPYFSTQNGNMTLLALTNTDQRNGKAVKVRFRGAQNSDDLFDFQVFLSPGDVWTAGVVRGADGRSQLITSDNSCTKPAKSVINGRSFGTSRLNPALSDADKAAGTREGYVEIFNMADIEPNVSSDVAGGVAGTITDGLGLYPIIKHVNGVAPCANIAANVVTGTVRNDAWTFIDGTDATPDRLYAELTAAPAAATAHQTVGMANPTTGLLANWTIINVPNATSWTGSAAAIEAVTAPAAPGVPALAAGTLIYYPQTDRSAGSAAQIAAGTADPLLIPATDRTGAAVPASITALKVDLPDMSTSYTKVGGALVTPSVQAANLATSISTSSLNNEFWANADISGATDWVMSMPTRRYATAVHYTMPQATATADAYTAGSTVRAPGRVFNAANAQHFAAANTSLRNGVACVTGIDYTLFDREERVQNRVGGGVVVSPAEPGARLVFCGETSVVAFNSAGATASPVLGAAVTLSGIDSNFNEGWARLTTPGAVAGGLPILGAAFASAYHPQVSAGTSGNYSMTWEHRYVRP